MRFTAVTLLVTYLFGGAAAVGCVDGNGNAVDWWAIYKLPKIHDSSNNRTKNGVSFLYQDVNAPGKWTQPPLSINDSTTALTKTLVPLFAAIGKRVGEKSKDSMLIWKGRLRMTSTTLCTMTSIRIVPMTGTTATRKAFRCSKRSRVSGSSTGKYKSREFSKRFAHRAVCPASSPTPPSPIRTRAHATASRCCALRSTRRKC